jgi:penicillin-binding protein 1A
VRVSQDQNFFRRPARESALAIRIGRWLHEDIPPIGETKLERSIRLNRPSETSIAIGDALSHEEILDWFINEVPMGQGCYGIPEAAMAYFGKTTAELRLEEIAYLAASIGSPERFHPHKSRDQAMKRRNYLLLSMMAKDGLISIEEAQHAAEAPLATRNPLGTCGPNN